MVFMFANSPLEANVATFKLGLFGTNDNLYVIASRLILNGDDEHDSRKYKYYVVTNESFKSKELPDVVGEFKKRVQDLGKSEKYKTTSFFAKNKTVTVIFDTNESVVLGK
jgi:hypothetical protein